MTLFSRRSISAARQLSSPFPSLEKLTEYFMESINVRGILETERDISEFAQLEEILEPCQGRSHSMMGSLELPSTKEKL